jgi:acyl carrier protein
VLEVGAGTGGTTAKVLPALKASPGRITYDYTDVSMAFTNYGRQHFADCPFARFKTLNIENDPASQGFEVGSYDVVIAANVLHATADIRRTLRHVKQLLKANGWLVLYEVTAKQDVMTLTFGLLDGWWLFEDASERLPGSPLLSAEMWSSLLAQEGFRCPTVYGRKVAGGEDTFQAVIVAESDGLVESGSTGSGAVARLASAGAAPRRVAAVNAPAPVHRAGSAALREAVTECIVKVLTVGRSQFDLDMPFMEMGVDSILAVDLINTINAALGIRLRPTDMFNLTTPRALCEHIEERFGMEHGGGPSSETGENADPDSDDELTEMLRQLGQNS